MTAEKNVSRPKTGLDRVVDDLRDLDQIEALSRMDPLSVGLLTGDLVARKRVVETPKFRITLRGFASRP